MSCPLAIYKLDTQHDSSTDFILPKGATRSPDAPWVSQPRWDALTTEQKGTFANICPDFVVELRSSSDRIEPLQAKMKEYIDNGPRLVPLGGSNK